MNKLEAAAVKRFTFYDKLCKTCPTLLRPRVETLTKMVMGLSAGEREELLANVGRLMEEGYVSEVRTARDVYDFQVAARATGSSFRTGADTAADPRPTGNAGQENRVDIGKLQRKMEKMRGKFEANKLKAARASRLLEVTTLLLGKSQIVENPSDTGLYHEIDELRSLAPGELKMQRLKYSSQKAKYEQKLAKVRSKLYDGSCKLTEANKEYV